MKFCFHKWQHLGFDGQRLTKEDPKAVLKFCTKCGTRRSKAIITEFCYWFIPIPKLYWDYWKIPRNPWWIKI